MITTTAPRAAPAALERHEDDLRIGGLDEIPRPVDLLREAPAPAAIASLVHDARASISRILTGQDPRLLAIVGPCSVHDPRAALEYASWLHDISRELEQWLLIVMRVYVIKPRTRSGWKGLIHDPHLDSTCRIGDGLKLARALLLEINAMGVPTATEFVDPFTPQYIGDLISWASIGARTTESQVHRELASGLSCPVGFKNGTSGDVRIAVNAVIAASRPHRFLGITKSGRAALVTTTGNTDCHVVLRGGPRPNHDRASVRAAVACLEAEAVCPRVMVDCSHGNCRGDPRRQLAVARDVARQRSADGREICGVMVESNLMAGSQPFVAGRPLAPGLSITDACLGLDDTVTLLRGLVPGRAGI